mmetsp:Transcript_27336/g.60517  ORF Transcript_27336/g.60517 Transcript_27336/m.60517 type:complete len:293 (+) Transcript_27336:178-1056(+)
MSSYLLLRGAGEHRLSSLAPLHLLGVGGLVLVISGLVLGELRQDGPGGRGTALLHRLFGRQRQRQGQGLGLPDRDSDSGACSDCGSSCGGRLYGRLGGRLGLRLSTHGHALGIARLLLGGGGLVIGIYRGRDVSGGLGLSLGLGDGLSLLPALPAFLGLHDDLDSDPSICNLDFIGLGSLGLGIGIGDIGGIGGSGGVRVLLHVHDHRLLVVFEVSRSALLPAAPLFIRLLLGEGESPPRFGQIHGRRSRLLHPLFSLVQGVSRTRLLGGRNTLDDLFLVLLGARHCFDRLK